MNAHQARVKRAWRLKNVNNATRASKNFGFARLVQTHQVGSQSCSPVMAAFCLTPDELERLKNELTCPICKDRFGEGEGRRMIAFACGRHLCCQTCYATGNFGLPSALCAVCRGGPPADHSTAIPTALGNFMRIINRFYCKYCEQPIGSRRPVTEHNCPAVPCPIKYCEGKGVEHFANCDFMRLLRDYKAEGIPTFDSLGNHDGTPIIPPPPSKSRARPAPDSEAQPSTKRLKVAATTVRAGTETTVLD
jgi:hypothetical protein